MELKIDPQPVQKKFLTAEEKIVFFGGGAGGGKTWSILVDNLKGVHDPDYFSAFFRSTTTELETNLWPEALKMYEPILFHQKGINKGKPKNKAHISEKKMQITFPSGAKSKFAYMQHDKDADSWYGAELCRIYIDEFQKHSDYQFQILRSRNRSRANVHKGIRCTLNPESEHFVYDWVLPYLDEEGFPRIELSGRTRYFLLVDGELKTSWDKQELVDQFGKNPQTYSYIPATLADNEVLMDMDPEYMDNLDSLPEKKRKSLLLGCWSKDEDTGSLFQRKWLRKVSPKNLPKEMTYVRAWDMASEIPKEENRYPDFTYGLLMAKGSDGLYYILNGQKFQERPGARNQRIINIANSDKNLYGDVTCITAIDPGAGGKVAYQEFAKQLTANGIRCKPDVVANNKSKRIKYEPFSDSCENGLVCICEELWDKDELDYFYRMSELFDGVSRSTSKRKDDGQDCSGMAFNFLCKTYVSDIKGLSGALSSQGRTSSNPFREASKVLTS